MEEELIRLRLAREDFIQLLDHVSLRHKHLEEENKRLRADIEMMMAVDYWAERYRDVVTENQRLRVELSDDWCGEDT